MCIDESKSAGDVLTFNVVDATGKLYTTSKAAPNSGFVNGKYYYNSSAIDLGNYKLQLVKPTLSRSDGGKESELTDAEVLRYFYIKSPSKSGAGAAQGITMSMSGTSTGYWFILDGDNSNTVNISGLTATFDESADYIDSYNSLTLNISGDNTISCKNYDYCVLAYGDLKLSGNGTLTVTAKSTTYYGLYNYDGSNVSALAAPGHTVMRSARSDGPDADSDGNPDYYTWTYTVYPSNVNLAALTGDYTALDGQILTGTLDGSTQPYKISIADGATVTLDGVTINGVNDGDNYQWAGINCEGNATIILKDGTTNVVKGFHKNYPGIYIAVNKTLTIQGNTGTLAASPFNGGGESGSYAAGAGIGGGCSTSCGNIVIEGGVITAKGGSSAAGIGAGDSHGCGNISISGGTVTAYGYGGASGIGSGVNGSCGSITISGTACVEASCVGTNSDEGGAGIGSAFLGNCGDINISTSGTVTATGEINAAGIGSGSNMYGNSGRTYCGNISITGGTITAEGKRFGAGIGSGYYGASCGTITIGSGITRVSAKSNSVDAKCIGAGYSGTCGTVTVATGLSDNGTVSNGTRVITHP
jgi:hypothetical protein